MRAAVVVALFSACAASAAVRAQPAPEPPLPESAPAAPPATPPASPPELPTTTPAPAFTAMSAANKPSAPPAAAGKLKLIVLDLKASSLTSAEASAMTSLITVTLSEFSALEVVSGADVKEMMALEGEKQTMGCEESMSCLAEIAGALGARIVAYGQIEKLGSRYLMTVNLQDTQAGRSAGRLALQGDGLDAIAAATPAALQKVAMQLLDDQHLPTTSTSARTEAPKLAQPTAPSDHGGLAWTGGIAAVVGGVVLAGTYFGSLAIASGNGAPGEIVQALKVPVVGPFLAGSQLLSAPTTSSTATPPANGSATAPRALNGGGNDSLFIVLSFAAGGVESLAAAAVVGGAAAWGGAVAADGPKLGAAGNLYRWGLVVGGVGLVAGGAAFDALSPTSSDRKLDAADFVAPTLEVAGVVAAGVGLLTNPFPAADAE